MGARIDQSLNDAGRTMSKRIGLALSYLNDDGSCGGGGRGGGHGATASSCGPVVPRVVVHSPLRRSIETAQIASAAFDAATRDDWKHSHGGTKKTTMRSSSSALQLPSLRSLDYGQSYTGQPAAGVRDGMLKTYAAWSDGHLDVEMDGGGETGFEVLRRAAASLCSLARIGNEVGGPVLAISHSSFLRIMLAMIMDVRLDKAMMMLSQDNGCINVLDMETSTRRVVRRGCKLLGGTESVTSRCAPASFSLSVPKTCIVRINEVRHL